MIHSTVTQLADFGGITFQWGAFGTAFDTWWKKLFGAILVGALIFAGANLVMSLAGLSSAKEAGRAEAVAASRTKVGHAIAGVIGVAAATTILGALLFVAA